MLIQQPAVRSDPTSKQGVSRLLTVDHAARLLWLDAIKGIALLWIVLVHITERIFGFPFFANPTAAWPPLGERIAQLAPLTGYGLLDGPINLLRYVGWAGDAGVQLFLIVSGFGLAWGLFNEQAGPRLQLREFYQRRLARIYPLWWGAHLLLLLPAAIVGWNASLTSPATYLSMLGIRLTANQFYYFAPAWWYVGLLIQLYLVFPLLWFALHRLGIVRFAAVCLGIGFASRAFGLFLLTDYMDAWQRGAIFLTRLPEFAFGICLAAWFRQNRSAAEQQLQSTGALVTALIALLVGIGLSLTLAGMIAAPFLLGVGAFMLFYRPMQRIQTGGRITGAGAWLGRHSYTLFLVHHPIILALIPVGGSIDNPRIIGGIVAALLLSGITAIVLETGVAAVQRRLVRLRQTWGTLRLAAGLVSILIMIAGCLIGAELAVRTWAPREIGELGWGERAALQPDPQFDYTLIPSSRTRLRWESYDYTVTANQLGFPGPAYPAEKTPETLRILTVGDAFTSAEGVDTPEAWPRLLEHNLADRFPGRTVQVMNFAITGYGPNQYAAVLEHFVPIYKPDLVIIGMFVNDYQDVLLTSDEYRTSIGFDRPPDDTITEILKLHHLRQWLQTMIGEPLRAFIRGTPGPYRYFLGGFAAFERDRPDAPQGRARTAERLAQIRALSERYDARVVVAMIPAAIQVCRADQLAYYPHNVRLGDTTRYDLELPQRTTREIAATLQLGFYDLRPALVQGGCVYQPWNIHWLPEGHRAVAAYLANRLPADGYLAQQRGRTAAGAGNDENVIAHNAARQATFIRMFYR